MTRKITFEEAVELVRAQYREALDLIAEHDTDGHECEVCKHDRASD